MRRGSSSSREIIHLQDCWGMDSGRIKNHINVIVNVFFIQCQKKTCDLNWSVKSPQISSSSMTSSTLPDMEATSETETERKHWHWAPAGEGEGKGKGEVCLFCLWSEFTWQADAGQTQLWRSSDHVVLSSQQRSGLNPVKPWSVGLMMGCSSPFTSGSQHHNSCAETLRIIILFCLKPKFFRFGGSPWSHG